MPKSEEENEQIRLAQRTNILDGARKALSRKGFSATMSDIAAAAGISQGLAYHYFPSKQEILAELLNKQVETCLEVLRSGLEKPGLYLKRIVNAKNFTRCLYFKIMHYESTLDITDVLFKVEEKLNLFLQLDKKLIEK